MKWNYIALGVMLASLEILSVAPMNHAAVAAELDSSDGTITDTFSPDVKFSLHR